MYGQLLIRALKMSRATTKLEPGITEENKGYIKIAIYNFAALLLSFCIGLTCAAFLPQALVFSGVYFIFMGLAGIAVVGLYAYNVVVKERFQNQPVEDSDPGFNEFCVGFILGLFYASTLLFFELVVPGAIIVSLMMTLAVFLSAIAYVAMDALSQYLGENFLPDYIPMGLIKTVFAVTLGGLFLALFANVSGIALFGFIVELVIFGLLSMVMVFEVHSLLKGDQVRCFFVSGDIEISPKLAAFSMFSRAIDLILTGARLVFYWQFMKDRDGSSFDMQELFYALGIFTLVGSMLYMMVNNEVKAETVTSVFSFEDNNTIYEKESYLTCASAFTWQGRSDLIPSYSENNHSTDYSCRDLEKAI